MTSWRDGLPETTQVELNVVLTAAVSFAETMLEAEGAFYPYSVGLTEAGTTEMATVPAGSDDVLDQLLVELASKRDALRAGAVVAAVHLESIDSNAVRVDLEHRDGVALIVILPFTRKKRRKKVEWSEMQAMVVESRIWGA